MSTLKVELIEGSLMPAGKYCIGDLSHILPSDLYKDFVCSFEHHNEVVLLKKGRARAFHVFHDVMLEQGKMRPFFLCNSIKNSQENKLCDEEVFEYNMDCGSLGIVEIASPYLMKFAEENVRKGLVQIIDFSSDFKVKRELLENESIYRFGDVQVLTYTSGDED